MAFYNLKTSNSNEITPNTPKVLLRGDSSGRVSVWKIPEIMDNNFDKVLRFEPRSSYSLSNAWKDMEYSPCGIIDTLVKFLVHFLILINIYVFKIIFSLKKLMISHIIN